jgi:hypothetical protein
MPNSHVVPSSNHIISYRTNHARQEFEEEELLSFFVFFFSFFFADVPLFGPSHVNQLDQHCFFFPPRDLCYAY